MAQMQADNKIFIWEGNNINGERVNGVLNGPNMAIIKQDLRRQGIIPIKIRKKASPFFSIAHKKSISIKDITFFTRQLATMMQAGIPLVQSMDIIAKGHTNPTLSRLLTTIRMGIEEGHSLSETFSKHPSYFDELYCSFVQAGEQSGSLDIMLARVATHKEKTEMLKGKVKKALFYPAAVIVVAILVTTVLLVWVVPQFQTLYQGFGADLPLLTLYVIKLSKFVQAYWWLLAIGIVATGTGYTTLKRRSLKVRLASDRALLNLPIIGIILKKAAIARFARTLATTFTAGLPLVEALPAVARSTGNLLFNNATMQIRESLATGQRLQVAMRATDIFPDMVVQMVAIGEESGALEQMLCKVADFYEADVDNAVDSLSSLLEPLIMVILGVLVGGLVIAMYLPIFKLGNVV